MMRAIMCKLGFHPPSLVSIGRRNEEYIALCERCTMPLVRTPAGKWRAAEPL